MKVLYSWTEDGYVGFYEAEKLCKNDEEKELICYHKDCCIKNEYWLLKNINKNETLILCPECFLKEITLLSDMLVSYKYVCEKILADITRLEIRMDQQKSFVFWIELQNIKGYTQALKQLLTFSDESFDLYVIAQKLIESAKSEMRIINDSFKKG